MWRRGKVGIEERFPSVCFSGAFWVSKHGILSCLNNKIKPKEKSVEFLNLEQTETKEAKWLLI